MYTKRIEKVNDQQIQKIVWKSSWKLPQNEWSVSAQFCESNEKWFNANFEESTSWSFILCGDWYPFFFCLRIYTRELHPLINRHSKICWCIATSNASKLWQVHNAKLLPSKPSGRLFNLWLSRRQWHPFIPTIANRNNVAQSFYEFHHLHLMS